MRGREISICRGVVLPVLLAVALRAEEPPKFAGRRVTIVESALDEDGYFPKGPASVCIEGPPQRQCFTAPNEFGRNPKASLVQLGKGESALLFSVASGGVSGFTIRYWLLRPGTGKDLSDLFFAGVSVPNQSQSAFWIEGRVSDAPIFLTAEYVSGPDEGHYGEHRYMISAYVQRPSAAVDERYFYLEDRFMTARMYDLDEKADVLKSEKQEILARLMRRQAEERNKPPRR